MNIELMTMAKLTMTAKYMLKIGSSDSGLTPNANIAKMIFRFTARGEGDNAYPAVDTDSREEWLRILRERGAEDFKMIMADELDDYGWLTMFNRVPCVILCFYKDAVTAWNRMWSFDIEKEKWVVLLVETVIENPPAEKPRFGDVSQDMANLLPRLRALSQKLDLSEFSFAFNAALKSLQADFVHGGPIPPAHQRLLQAATEAYVFGGEDSWNGKGKAAAESKGLTAEYEALTKDLYRGIALSLMYVVNEW